MTDSRLRKYAHLAVKSGVNIQPDQLLVIHSPVHCADFVHLCVEEAYKLQAKKVTVHYNDEVLERLDALHVEKEILKEVPQWMIDRKQAEIDQGCAYLHIDSHIPEIMEGVDSAKMQEVMIHRQTAMKQFQNYTAANHGQWSIVAIPNPKWAMKVFDDCSEEEAMEKLWQAIYKSVYVEEENDPVQTWIEHSNRIRSHCDRLNQMNLKALHFKNKLGTDLTLELVPHHIWAGGMEKTDKNIAFNPNMPTEEVFTMPMKTKVWGKVVSTKPLNYQGQLIEDFTLTFEEGKAVSGVAKTCQEALDNLLAFDEGSAYLGEVALISHDSPISNSQILFYDTLFDENASCHLALGRAYPMNVQGGTTMSEAQLEAAGSNLSMTHVDFMFGSADMEIDGITQDDQRVAIFRSGNFVF